MTRCPGCAGEPHIQFRYSDDIRGKSTMSCWCKEEYAVVCDCGWCGPWCHTMAEAIAAWNTRKVTVDMDKPERNFADHNNTRKVNND